MRIARSALCVGVLVAVVGVSRASADEVTYWNGVLLRASAVAPATNPTIMTRNAAIVHAAIFDAFNGIERRFTPVRVEPDAEPGASRRAAIVQAAYSTILALYPAQKNTLDAELASSLDAIASGEARDHSLAIARGIAWGQYVADQILLWRSTDGFSTSPAIFDGLPLAVGRWRPTPPNFALGFGFPQFSAMTPWVIDSGSAFRPEPPPAIGSARYVADFNEVKQRTAFAVANPTSDDALLSIFWNVGTATAYWDRVAIAFSQERRLTLSQNARLMALLSLAMADAAIGCWDAKYTFVYWRPITAIAGGVDDGDSRTVEDPSWTTLLPTPPHPEYPSGHSCLTGAAGEVLIRFFGDETPFTLESNTVAGQYRSYENLSSALAEVKDARVFAGIHFRTATEVGQMLGARIGRYVLTHALRPWRDERRELER